MSDSKELAPVQTMAERAIALLETKTEKKRSDLVALAAGTADIKTITNAAGRQQVHAAMMVLANTRISLEKAAKEARDKARVWTDELRAQELELVGITSPEEKRLKSLRDEWDNRIEAERKAKADAEAKRVADIRARITAIGNAAVVSFGTTALQINASLDELTALTIGDDFAEFAVEAGVTRDGAIAALTKIHAAAVESEAAVERVRLQQIENERVRLENERQAKAAADALAAQKAKQDAEAAAAAKIEQERQAEAVRREREQLDRERQQQEAAAKIERDRIAAEAEVARKAHEQREREAKLVRDAEEARIAAERKKLADEQEAARVAALRDRTAAQDAEREIIIHFTMDKWSINEASALAKLQELFS
jgi:hypothetical protein